MLTNDLTSRESYYIILIVKLIHRSCKYNLQTSCVQECYLGGSENTKGISGLISTRILFVI